MNRFTYIALSYIALAQSEEPVDDTVEGQHFLSNNRNYGPPFYERRRYNTNPNVVITETQVYPPVYGVPGMNGGGVPPIVGPGMNGGGVPPIVGPGMNGGGIPPIGGPSANINGNVNVNTNINAGGGYNNGGTYQSAGIRPGYAGGGVNQGYPPMNNGYNSATNVVGISTNIVATDNSMNGYNPMGQMNAVPYNGSTGQYGRNIGAYNNIGYTNNVGYNTNIVSNTGYSSNTGYNTNTGYNMYNQGMPYGVMGYGADDEEAPVIED